MVEFAASSLRIDWTGKARIYARAGIPVYWIVNLTDRVIEVYTGPGGAGSYATRDDYPAGTAAPVVLDGATVGAVPVSEVTG